MTTPESLDHTPWVGRSIIVGGWLGLLLLEVGLIVVARNYEALPGATPFGFFLYGLVAVATLAGTVGLVLRIRRPENGIGRLLAIGPLLMIAGFLGYGGSVYRFLVAGPTDVLGGALGAVAGAITPPGILLTLPAIGIVFPDGRLPGPRWRLPIRVTIALLVAGSFGSLVSSADLSAFPSNPFAIPGLPSEVGAIASASGTIGLMAAMLMSVVAVTVRFRRARGVERQQLKWFAASVALTAIVFPVSFLTDTGEAIDLLSLFAAALIPVAIGIAILRYRLYEIDRIISRTISWAITTGVIVAVFAGIVVGLQGILGQVTGGNTVAVAASTLVAFALFQPLRRWVQAAVDRRFNRSGYDAQRLVDSFAERVRVDVDLTGLGSALAATAGEAVRPAGVGIWIRRRPADTV